MFGDRVEAGRALATHLAHLRDDDAVVVGLPRGGVPVAAEVADALDAPLDVILVRKVGFPTQPELAMGAIGEDGVRVVNNEFVQPGRGTMQEFERIAARERVELDRRTEVFRRVRRPEPLSGRTVIIVDDGIATGSTARAACQVARAHGAARVVLATPVAPDDWAQRLGDAADEYVCVESPAWFGAVGSFYADFRQVDDEEVVALLRRHAPPGDARSGPRSRPSGSQEVTLRLRDVDLPGSLDIPEDPVGVVVFAHGSGSSRHSPRNRAVARVLQRAGIATLLFDLLTDAEADDRRKVFDIDLLAGRLGQAVDWVHAHPATRDLPVGVFGASTGAAAALCAAADRPEVVAAVVSRGGRPDLAGSCLPAVRAPTLLIVGARDGEVLDLNRSAGARLRCPARLAIVPGATHLFSEPGALEQVAELAREWFRTGLGPVPAGGPPA